MRDDVELLRAYADEGCEASFAEFVRRHIDVVYHTAVRRLNGNTHLAEEVVQSVFVHAARKCRMLSRHPAVLGWLHTSTRYAAAAIVRRETRRIAREQAAYLMDPEPTADDSLPWESLRPWIDEALDRLGETERHAVLLRFFAGRSFAEIGAELRVSEEASRKRVERAVKDLREHLARRGITTTAAALTAALAATPAVAAPTGLAATVAAAATSAAAGGTLASGLTIFMSTVKLYSVTGAAATLAGIALLGTTAFVEMNQRQQEERMRLDALSTLVQAERVTLARLKRVTVAKADATNVAARARTPAATATPANPDAFAQQQLRQRELLATSPEYRPIRQQELRLRVQREYGAFFAARGYSPDKVESLTRALVLIYDAEEREQLAVLKADPSAKVSSDKTLAEENRLILEKINEFLGAEEAERMRRYHLGRRSLTAVRDFSLDLSEVGCPLTPVQETNLATAMGESRDAICNPNLAQLSKQLDPATGLSGVDQWQIDRARAFLTPEQLRRFEDYLRTEHQRAIIASRVAGQIRQTAMP
jgi:RNA polymerase sigma factor (sigma-70 family)